MAQKMVFEDIILEREVKRFGKGGAHITIPNRFLGCKLRVIIKVDDELIKKYFYGRNSLKTSEVKDKK